MRGRDYQQYLNSPQWQIKREAWFAKFGRRCRGCGRIDGPLHLHHLTYANFRNEPLSDLVALCPRCHRGVEELHYKMGRGTDRRVVLQAFKMANLKSQQDRRK